jgi:competence protein ComEA
MIFPIRIRLRSLGLPLLLWAALGWHTPAAFAQLPEGPGKEITQQVCGNCHASDVLLAHRQSRDEWVNEIQKMITAGAEGTEEQFTAVLDYVSKYLGPSAARINVNKATAADLESGLGLSTKESAAVVKYRSDKGAFKTVEDLKKVPDLDFKKIETQKERLDF